jgi:dihydrofolate reductase
VYLRALQLKFAGYSVHIAKNWHFRHCICTAFHQRKCNGRGHRLGRRSCTRAVAGRLQSAHGSPLDVSAFMTAQRIGLIWAQARGGVIGKGGVMPWHLPEDLAHFKRTTLSHPVIMGRKTWDSLPPRFRPLPGRDNIVVTRQPDWHEIGVQRASSLREALQKIEHFERVWVIGGAQIYAQALPLADEVVVTEIDADFDGDAFAPTLGPEWREVAREPLVGAGGTPMAFVTYCRAQGAA